MTIELKNISRSPRIAGAFMAFLYIDGEKAGLVWNRGSGRPTGYHPLDAHGSTLIAAAELEHLLKHPPKSMSTCEGAQPLASLLEQLAKEGETKKQKHRGPKP